MLRKGEYIEIKVEHEDQGNYVLFLFLKNAIFIKSSKSVNIMQYKYHICSIVTALVKANAK